MSTKMAQLVTYRPIFACLRANRSIALVWGNGVGCSCEHLHVRFKALLQIDCSPAFVKRCQACKENAARLFDFGSLLAKNIL